MAECNEGCIVGIAVFILLCGLLLGFMWQVLRSQADHVDTTRFIPKVLVGGSVKAPLQATRDEGSASGLFSAAAARHEFTTAHAASVANPVVAAHGVAVHPAGRFTQTGGADSPFLHTPPHPTAVADARVVIPRPTISEDNNDTDTDEAESPPTHFYPENSLGSVWAMRHRTPVPTEQQARAALPATPMASSATAIEFDAKDDAGGDSGEYDNLAAALMHEYAAPSFERPERPAAPLALANVEDDFDDVEYEEGAHDRYSTDTAGRSGGQHYDIHTAAVVDPNVDAATAAASVLPPTTTALLENRQAMAKMRQSLRRLSAVRALGQLSSETVMATEGDAKISELATRISSTQSAMEETQRRIDDILAREEALNAAAERIRMAVVKARAVNALTQPVQPVQLEQPKPPVAPVAPASPQVPPNNVDDAEDEGRRFNRNDPMRSSKSKGYNPERFAMLSRLFEEKRRTSEIELSRKGKFAVHRAAEKWLKLVEKRRAERKAAAKAAAAANVAPPLPSGWVEHIDAQGQIYYASAGLGKSQWHRPS